MSSIKPAVQPTNRNLREQVGLQNMRLNIIGAPIRKNLLSIPPLMFQDETSKALLISIQNDAGQQLACF
jgi:hypothetical protein